MRRNQRNLAILISLLLVLCVTASEVSNDIDKVEVPVHYKTVRDREFFDLTHNGYAEGYFVFFGADWCGHCQNFKPVFQKLAENSEKGIFKTKPIFIHYGMDERDTISSLFKINAFPTLVFIKGDRFCKFNDNRSEENLVKFFTSNDMSGPQCQPYSSAYPGYLDLGLMIGLEFLEQLSEEYNHYKVTNPGLTYGVIGLVILTFILIIYASYLCARDIGKPAKRRPQKGDAPLPKKEQEHVQENPQNPGQSKQEKLEEKKEK